MANVSRILKGGRNVIRRRRAKIDPSMRRWLTQYPALKVALTKAQMRFGYIPGVLGFGVGRKYCEKKKRYGAAPASTGGLCIKVLVERKKGRVPFKEKIPRSLRVAVPGRQIRFCKVLIDVVSLSCAGDKPRSRKTLQEGRGWPTARVVTPGRLFAFGKKTAENYGVEFSRSQQVRLGTTGVVIQYGGDYFAVSAGHVFAEPCQEDTDRPKGLRAIGVKDRSFVRVEGDEFFPNSVENGKVISDVMGYRIPASVLPETFSWPDGFSGELATQADIDRAIFEEERITAFVWVERGGIDRPQAIPLDVELQLTGFEHQVNCDGDLVSIKYGASWGLRFTSMLTTVGGDSGAAVFIIGEDGFHSRLLGFHFLMSGGRSYAMDAKTFLEDNFHNPAREVVFP